MRDTYFAPAMLVQKLGCARVGWVAMIFANRGLAERLEAAEGFACVQFAEARKRLFPECGSAWMKCAGADVVFDGVDAPTTQTFGVGMFEELTLEKLDEMERFL